MRMKAAFLRTVRSRSLWLLALCTVLALPLAGRTMPVPLPEGAAYAIVPDALSAEDAAALCRRLEGLDFVPAEDADAVRAGILRGDWGCGLVVDAAGARFLQAENAANGALWRGAAGAALFSLEAPYLTARALEDCGVSSEGVRERYDALYDAGSAFAITLQTVEGQPLPDTQARDRTLLAGAAACLLGAVFAAAIPVYDDGALLRRRGLTHRARLGLLGSQLLLRAAVLSLATVLGAVLAGQGMLALRLVPYLLLCTALATLTVELLRRPGAVAVAAAMLCLLLPVLCPVYIDLSLAVPRLAAVQRLFLPWWLFYGL